MLQAGIIYIILSVVYIICCILDGPDLKPIWKKYVGIKLYNIHKKFYDATPIPICPPLPFEPIRIETSTFDAIDIRCREKISEWHLMEYSKMYGNDIDNVISNSINRIYKGIFEQIKNNNLIDIEIDKENDYPNIIITGNLKVGQKRNY